MQLKDKNQFIIININWLSSKLILLICTEYEQMNFTMRNWIYTSILFLILSGTGIASGVAENDSVRIIDSRHYSNIFGEIRNYRVFLPPGYHSNPLKRYPVIYFYHGWSQRYFGSGPDGYNHFEKGDDNKIGRASCRERV